MTAAQFRQLKDWPTFEAIGSGNQNEPRCVDCHQRPDDHSPHCVIAQRNAALDAAAQQSEQIEKALAFCERKLKRYEPEPDDLAVAITKTVFDLQRILRGGDHG